MKFDLHIYFTSGKQLQFKSTTFISCDSVEKVREWLNGSHKFINIGSNLINTDNVDYFTIVEVP
jgi:hypothetical protein